MVTINWGDGTPLDTTSGMIVNGFLQGSHTYADLTSSGFGVPWGQSRAWSNNPGYASSLNGLGAVQTQQPFLLPGLNGQVAVISNGTNARFFDYNNMSGTYTPHFAFAQEALSYNATTHLFTLTDTKGQRLTFDDFSTMWPVNQRGQFTSFMDAGNNMTSVMSWINGNPGEVQRSTSGTVESYKYDYVSSGPNQGLVAAVTLRRGPSTSDPWTVVRQSVYTYYDGVASYGNVGDLQTASVLDAAGHVLYTDYYRYYTPADAGTIGYVHGLKYVFSTQSYARLVAAYLNPFTATDANVAPYADNYFEYDNTPQHRVTKEIAQGAGSSSTPALGAAPGQGIYTYQYSVNPNNPPLGYNTWANQTMETLPDGNQNIVYTNGYGQVMLNVFQSGGQQWLDDYQYDAAGRLIEHVRPSAVSGYDATRNDLVDGHLNADSGLVELTDYYQAGSGQPAGYVKDTKVQRGQNTSSATMLTSMDYLTQTANGVTIYLVSHAYAYRTGTLGDPGEQTTYAYPQFYPGTNLIQLMTVTKPVIGAGQNGPGTADVDTTFSDTYGRPIWHMNADGFIDYTAYDQATGAVIKTITDVDYNKLSTTEQASFRNTGWAHPTGGLHLVTQMVVDSLGRTTQLTDPDGHVTDTVYDDPDHEIRTYAGWQSWDNRPTGPTTVTREDRPGSYTETLTMSATPAVLNGVPTGTEPISNLQTLSRTLTSPGGQVTESDAYFNLSGVTYATGSFHLGTANTTYYATTSGYDAAGRPNRQQSPTLTIQRTVYDGLGRVVSTWVGLNDVGATDTDPTGGGAMNNDMQEIGANIYDGGGVGDSDLTKHFAYPTPPTLDNPTPDDQREIDSFYDWRDRLVATKDGVQASEDTSTHRPIMYRYYDNLDEVLATEQYDGDTLTISSTEGVPNAPPELDRRARAETSYDDQGRAYQSRTDDVVQSGANAGMLLPNDTSPVFLATNTYYNHRGQVMASAAPGGLWTKSAYDGAGRTIATYTTDGLADITANFTWTAASSPVGDNVLTQTQTTYDANGNPTLATTKDRFHNETATGPLMNPAMSPKARVSSMASYYDLADRRTDQIDVGTNGGAAYLPGPMPPMASDTILVTHTAYNAAGWVDSVTDPRGLVVKTIYDNLGRAVTTFDAYTDGVPTNTNNRETDYTYDGAGHTLSVMAVLPGGVQQQTQYTYGASITLGSAIDSNDMLQAVTYPGQSQQEIYTDDALGETLTMTDRNGTLHSYVRDVLGRQIADMATIPTGSSVDTTVQRLDTAYDTGDRPYLYTSYHDLAGTIIVNQVEQVYNGLGQLIQEYQAHAGAVVPGSTPSVQYAYNEMSNGENNSRLVSMTYPPEQTYPTGRQLAYSYGTTSDTLDDRISRLTKIADASGTLETYIDTSANTYADYLGLDTVVQRDHPQASGQLTQTDIAQPGDAPTGNAGDPYLGLDRFGRVVDQHWLARGGNPVQSLTTDRYQYGYDRDGNVLYRANVVTENLSTPLAFDELYGYDNFNQVVSFGRGTLNASRTGLVMGSVVHSQSWTLDPLGNWDRFTNDAPRPPSQTRTNNVQNQITSISGMLATPQYDANGNSTRDEQSNGYVYDAWNRLVHVMPGTGLPEQDGVDALGRRITTKVGSAGTVTDLYYSSQWQVLEEDQTSGGHTTLVNQYVWSPVYVDALIERDKPSYGRVYVQQDATWNVTALVDSSGMVQERYAYDAYGRAADQTGRYAGALYADWSSKGPSAYAWVYLFQGGRQDTASGLYNFRNRDYSPTLGRWMEMDPLGYVNGQNLYQYLGDSPETQRDPNGTDFIALADRPVKTHVKTGVLEPRIFYHYSLEYWKCPTPNIISDKGPKNETIIANYLKAHPGLKKAGAVQLLRVGGYQAWHIQIGIAGKAGWGIEDVGISVIDYGDSGRNFVSVFVGKADEVKRKWDKVTEIAKTYPYAEQPDAKYGVFRGAFKNWPKSIYIVDLSVITNERNNSNTFALYVVAQAGPQQKTLAGPHPGANSPVAIERGDWSKQPWPSGQKAPPPK